MKTILLTLVSGIFVCLLTSIGVNTEFENNTNTHKTITENNQCYYYNVESSCTIDCEIECLEFELFSNTEVESTIEPKDIIVYELEEDIELGFDTSKYLPKNFNPLDGMYASKELLTEEKLALKTIVNTIEFENIISVEDVVIFELEEDIELGFDTTKYLPNNFNPFDGMDTSNELLEEEELALKTIVSNMEIENIINIEDVVVYELEEDIELGFDTAKYLPKNFNPFDGMNSYNGLLTEEELALKTIINTIKFETIINIEDLVVY